MRRVDSNDPEKLSYRGGGGCLAFFGLPFLFAGLFTIYMALTFQMPLKKGIPAGALDAIAGSVFGLPFVLAGSALVFGRKGVIVDRRTKSLTSWWGALGWRRERRQPLETFDKVYVRRETRQVKNRTDTFFMVYLGDPQSSSNLFFDGSQTELSSRQLGEELAAFLRIPLVDASGGAYGDTAVRQGEHLNEPLHQRLQRTGEAVEVGPPPAFMVSKYTVNGNTVEILLPGDRFNVGIIPTLVVFGFLIYGGINFFTQHPAATGLGKDPVIKGFVGFICFGIPALLFLSAPTARYWGGRVEAEPGKLKIHRRFVGCCEFPADELEELRIESTRSGLSLAAVSDRRIEKFGNGLSREELEWIRNVVMKALTIDNRQSQNLE